MSIKNQEVCKLMENVCNILAKYCNKEGDKEQAKEFKNRESMFKKLSKRK